MRGEKLLFSKKFPSQLSAREAAIAQKIPGLVGLDRSRIRQIILGSRKSLLYGELSRWRKLFSHLDNEEYELDVLRKEGDKKRRLLQKVLYYFYFDGPLAPYAKGDFKHALESFQFALRDVEELSVYLLELLPELLEINGRSCNLHAMVRDPVEVSAERDPIELIRLARFGGRERSAKVSHAARMKLVIGQLFFDYRRYGFDPAQLKGRAEKTRAALEDQMFVRGSKKLVRILAKLDPGHAYACRSCQIIENPNEIVPDGEDWYVMEADRYLVEDAEGVFPVFFTIRAKRFPGLKSIIKDTRFCQIANIGDSVAMRFVVNDEHDLARIQAKCRETFVFRPGVVSDQRIPFMLQANQPAPVENKHSSDSFNLSKHSLLIRDSVYEVQFASIQDDVDANCRHDDGHHGVYRERQLSVEFFPLAKPEQLYGVPWPADFVKINGTSLPQVNVDIWEQLVTHVRAHENKGRF